MANNATIRKVQESKKINRDKVVETKTKKGFWHKLADRLVDNSCTRLPHECR